MTGSSLSPIRRQTKNSCKFSRGVTTRKSPSLGLAPSSLKICNVFLHSTVIPSDLVSDMEVIKKPGFSLTPPWASCYPYLIHTSEFYGVISRAKSLKLCGFWGGMAGETRFESSSPSHSPLNISIS